MTMRAFDLTPLLRSTIGFDQFDRLFEMASRHDGEVASYPPYNIEKAGEDSYRITMAVAGFAEDELAIVAQENTLIVSGRAADKDQANGDKRYLHRGIARRAFERRFQLADTIKVTGAKLENGLLHIDLLRVIPEAMKPRQIKIAVAADADADKVIEGEAA
jgi:molecular chaperone IbpA